MSMNQRKTVHLVPFVLCLLALAVTGQSGISGFVPMVGQLADVDDVVVMPSGQMILARPASQSIGYFNPGATPEYVPFLISPIVCSALAMGPDGHLYYGDSISGTVNRFNFANNTTQPVAIGLHIPIDVVFDSGGSLYICDLTNNDFFHGPCNVIRVDLYNGFIMGTTNLITVPGAADVAVGPFGEVIYASLGSPDVKALIPSIGQTVQVATNVFLPTDLMLTDNDQTLIVSCLYQGKVLSIDLATGTRVDLVSGLGMNQQGAEDVAIRANGNLVISVNTGEVYEMDLSSPMHQIGNARPGQIFGVAMDMPQCANNAYAILMSTSANTGMTIDGHYLPLDMSAFLLQTTSQRPTATYNFDGFLDANGRGAGYMLVPNLPQLAGFSVYMAAVAFDSGQSQLSGVSNGVQVIVEL